MGSLFSLQVVLNRGNLLPQGLHHLILARLYTRNFYLSLVPFRNPSGCATRDLMLDLSSAMHDGMEHPQSFSV